ncbi:hypothetical protein DSECCO2_313700 [anaerobic digester metagenome]
MRKEITSTGWKVPGGIESKKFYAKVDNQRIIIQYSSEYISRCNQKEKIEQFKLKHLFRGMKSVLRANLPLPEKNGNSIFGSIDFENESSISYKARFVDDNDIRRGLRTHIRSYRNRNGCFAGL